MKSLTELAPERAQRERLGSRSSTPSATTMMSSACPSPTMARTMAVRARSKPRPATKLASIFSSSTGQRRDVGERRVTGAEVVERDAHAESVERGRACVARRADVDEDAPLGDLDDEAGRLEPGAGQRDLDVLDEAVGAPNRSGVTFTQMVVGVAGLGPVAPCRQASSRTQSSIAAPDSLRCAIGRKSAGARRPRVGCCQRTSAS